MRRLKINIFDDDPMNLGLFAAIMATRNYEVYANDRAIVCPVYGTQTGKCGLLKPCADVIITDNRMPGITGIEMLLEQSQRGCRVDVRNKAVVSADLDNKQRKIVEGLGCAVFGKPFRLNDILAWLDDCESRIDLSMPLGIARKAARYPMDIEMVYSVAADEKIRKGTTLNYSESGLCLRTDTFLAEGQAIEIRSDLPNGCRSASVCWANKTGDDSYLAGIACQ